LTFWIKIKSIYPKEIAVIHNVYIPKGRFVLDRVVVWFCVFIVASFKVFCYWWHKEGRNGWIGKKKEAKFVKLNIHM